MEKILIIRPCLIGGQHTEPGTVVSLGLSDAIAIIGAGKGVRAGRVVQRDPVVVHRDAVEVAEVAPVVAQDEPEELAPAETQPEAEEATSAQPEPKKRRSKKQG